MLLDKIENALRSIDFDTITTVESKQCKTFEELIEVYKRDMVVTQSIQDCVAVCCAVHLATKLQGDPLWVYLVGAPSSGKSTICELVCADEFNSKPLSKFTGLVSGMRGSKHLLNSLQNKCVVIKDGTLLLEGAPGQLSNVFGELRDIYDGSLEAHYRNGVEASFSGISFGLIIGITERIYALNMSALGERFLHCRLETHRDTELQRNKSAISKIFAETGRTAASGDSETEDNRSFPLQRGYTSGFLNHLHDRVAFEEMLRPSWSDEDANLIQALADVVACSRASAPKDERDQIMYDSRPEASTRVVKQIALLAFSLCYVYNSSTITPEIRRVLKKVAKDTANSRQNTVITAVAQSGGLSRTEISNKTSISIEQVRRLVDGLISLGIFAEHNKSHQTLAGLPDTTSSKLTVPTWVKEAFTYGKNNEAGEAPKEEADEPPASTTPKRRKVAGRRIEP